MLYYFQLNFNYESFIHPHSNSCVVHVSLSFHLFYLFTIYTTSSSLGETKVNSSSAKDSIPEAGSDSLTFDAFDKVSEKTRNLLSLSKHLYCPEGHVPGTHVTCRIITNSAKLAPQLVAYMDRAPKKDPPVVTQTGIPKTLRQNGQTPVLKTNSYLVFILKTLYFTLNFKVKRIL